METLYQLLGALPEDSAEGVRVAFRNAVKSAHPDIVPGDPDAGLKFRQIVRANEILSDVEQRAAYDHLLVLADIEQEQGSGRAVAATIHQVATGAMAVAVASFVLLGGYLLFGEVNRILLGPAQLAEVGPAQLTEAETSSAEPATATVSDLVDMPAAASDKVDVDHASERETPNKIEEPGTTEGGATAAASASTTHEDENIPTADDFEAANANRYRAQATEAYRKGDLHLALIKLDRAIARDPASSDAYVDRAIVRHRLGDIKRAYADIAKAKSIDELNRRKTPGTATPRRASTPPGFSAVRSSTRS